MKSLLSLFASALIWCQCSGAYAAPKTITLAVPDMDCAACPLVVKKALSRVDGVSGVAVNYEQKEVVVSFDDAKTTVNTLTKATADAGFPSLEKGGSTK
jgi:mercuric ion binding protein